MDRLGFRLKGCFFFGVAFFFVFFWVRIKIGGLGLFWGVFLLLFDFWFCGVLDWFRPYLWCLVGSVLFVFFIHVFYFFP